MHRVLESQSSTWATSQDHSQLMQHCIICSVIVPTAVPLIGPCWIHTQAYAGQSHYQFHKFIKESNIAMSASRVAITFISSFLTHYTQILSSFVSRYSEIPHNDESIVSFSISHKHSSIWCRFLSILWINISMQGFATRLHATIISNSLLIAMHMTTTLYELNTSNYNPFVFQLFPLLYCGNWY